MADIAAEGSVQDLLQHMQATKVEHRELLGTISADPGMSPATRRALLEHLHEEEQEQLLKLQALLGGSGGAGTAPRSAPPSPGLTVGSLRPRESWGGGSVGSLRRD